jgi:hypothetical protein
MDNPENTERAITNEQSRETGNIGYTRRRKTKQINVRVPRGQSQMYISEKLAT